MLTFWQIQTYTRKDWRSSCKLNSTQQLEFESSNGSKWAKCIFWRQFCWWPYEDRPRDGLGAICSGLSVQRDIIQTILQTLTADLQKNSSGSWLESKKKKKRVFFFVIDSTTNSSSIRSSYYLLSAIFNNFIKWSESNTNLFGPFCDWWKWDTHKNSLNPSAAGD